MSNDNIHRTLLEHLPVEIVQQIFALLPLQDLVQAFFGLNFYINSIIRSVTGISHIVRYNDIKAISLLHLFPAQIGRLVISHAEKVDFTPLINLHSLTLKYGTSAQFESIRPQHFPMLEILHIYAISRISSNDNTKPISDLFQVILSNGFPRLRICTAARIGTLDSSEIWTGSPALRSLQLDMKTAGDYERLLSVCLNLRRFTSFGTAWIDPPKEIYDIQNNMRNKRILNELQKMKRLEFEGKFILDVSPVGAFYGGEPPSRFNNSTATRNFYPEGRISIRGRILPTKEPFCHASFLIEITLPLEYPFKRPEAVFLDPIYHPNVDESGRHCCCWGIGDSVWKPTTPLTDLILAVIHVIDYPNWEHNGVCECAQEYQANPQAFYKKALTMARTYGRPRY